MADILWDTMYQWTSTKFCSFEGEAEIGDMQGMGCWKYEEKYFPLDGVIPNQTGYLVKGINVHQCLQQEGGKTVEAHQKYDDAPQVWCNIQCTWSYRPILVATQSRDAEGTQLDTEQEKHMEV